MESSESSDVLNEKLLTPSEVASLLRVSTKTVNRWVLAGHITRIVTPGNHSRFRASEIRKLLSGDSD